MAPPENELPLAVDATQGQNQNVQSTRNVNRREIGRCSAWLWADKAVVRRIREAFDELPFLDQALAVYLVLCEIASDQENGSFTIGKRVIAERSGTSLRRVTEVLGIFKNLDVLTWKQNPIEGSKGLSANTYTLLALGTPCPTQGTVCATSGKGSPTLGKNAKRDFCRDIEESTEETIEETIEERKSVAAATPASTRTAKNRSIDQAWLESLRVDAAFTGLDVDRELAKMQRWCIQNHRQPTRRFFINWLNRADRPLPLNRSSLVQPNHAAGF
jgi:hypothetical protein